jgi:hypothetical protein
VTDPYAVLGVTPSASTEEIKRRFRDLARLLHPDRNHEASEREKAAAAGLFTAVAEAYQLLMDRERRAAYDASCATRGRKPTAPSLDPAKAQAASLLEELFSHILREASGSVLEAPPTQLRAVDLACQCLRSTLEELELQPADFEARVGWAVVEGWTEALAQLAEADLSATAATFLASLVPLPYRLAEALLPLTWLTRVRPVFTSESWSRLHAERARTSRSPAGSHAGESSTRPQEGATGEGGRQSAAERSPEPSGRQQTSTVGSMLFGLTALAFVLLLAYGIGASRTSAEPARASALVAQPVTPPSGAATEWDIQLTIGGVLHGCDITPLGEACYRNGQRREHPDVYCDGTTEYCSPYYYPQELAGYEFVDHVDGKMYACETGSGSPYPCLYYYPHSPIFKSTWAPLWCDSTFTCARHRDEL